ncbi:type VII secretion protein EssA [Bacillus cereus]|uniref:type VII secretion protein EssA n=1 Tax=Bacillus cereus TaxID=1396 RepID=UPI001EDE3C73|nr:type VII secretion protein EssA [Bacillus cereus]
MTAFLVLFLASPPLHADAGSYLDHNGKMDLKTDRVEQIKQEIVEKEQKETQETELEKHVPGLFKEQTKDVIKEKQKQIEGETKALHDVLFVTSDKNNTTVKDRQNSLFSQNYTVRNAVQADPKTSQLETESISTQMIGILFGAVLAICCSIYVVILKIWQ